MPKYDEIKQSLQALTDVSVDNISQGTSANRLATATELRTGLSEIAPDLQPTKISKDDDRYLFEGLGEFLWYGTGGLLESGSAGITNVMGLTGQDSFFGTMQDADTFLGKAGGVLGGGLGFIVPFKTGARALNAVTKAVNKAGSTKISNNIRRKVLDNLEDKDIVIKGGEHLSGLQKKQLFEANVLKPQVLDRISNWHGAFATAAARNTFGKEMAGELGTLLKREAGKQNIALNPNQLSKITDEVANIWKSNSLNGRPISTFQEAIAKKFGDGYTANLISHAAEEAAIFAAVENFAFTMRALAGEHEFSAQGYKDTTWHAITLGSILSGIRILTPGGLKEGSVDMMSKEGWINIRNLMFNRKPIGKQIDLNTEKGRITLGNLYKQYAKMEQTHTSGAPFSLLLRNRANHNSALKSQRKIIQKEAGGTFNVDDLVGLARSENKEVAKAAAEIMEEGYEYIFKESRDVWRESFKQMIKEDYIGGGAGGIGSGPRMLLGGIAMTGKDVLLDEDLPLEEKALHFFMGAFLMKSGKELTYRVNSGPSGFKTSHTLSEFGGGNGYKIQNLRDVHRSFHVNEAHPLFAKLSRWHRQDLDMNRYFDAPDLPSKLDVEYDLLSQKTDRKNRLLFYEGRWGQDNAKINNQLDTDFKVPKGYINKAIEYNKRASEIGANYQQQYIELQLLGQKQSFTKSIIKDLKLEKVAEDLVMKDWNNLSSEAKVKFKQYIDKNNILGNQINIKAVKSLEPAYQKTKQDLALDIQGALTEGLKIEVDGVMMPLTPTVTKSKLTGKDNYNFTLYKIDKLDPNKYTEQQRAAVLKLGDYMKLLESISPVHKIRKSESLPNEVDLSNIENAIKVLDNSFKRNLHLSEISDAVVDPGSNALKVALQGRQRLSVATELGEIFNKKLTDTSPDNRMGELLREIFIDGNGRARTNIQLPKGKNGKPHSNQQLVNNISKIIPVVKNAQQNYLDFQSDKQAYKIPKEKVSDVSELRDILNELGYNELTGDVSKFNTVSKGQETDFANGVLKQVILEKYVRDARDPNGNPYTLDTVEFVSTLIDMKIVDPNLNGNKFILSEMNAYGEIIREYNQRFPELAKDIASPEMVNSEIAREKLTPAELQNFETWVKLNQKFADMPKPQEINDMLAPLLKTIENPKGLIKTGSETNVLNDGQILNMVKTLQEYKMHIDSRQRVTNLFNSANNALNSNIKGYQQMGKFIVKQLMSRTDNQNLFIRMLEEKAIISKETQELRLDRMDEKLATREQQKEFLTELEYKIVDMMDNISRNWDERSASLRDKLDKQNTLEFGEQGTDSKSKTLNDILLENKTDGEFRNEQSDVLTHQDQVKIRYDQYQDKQRRSAKLQGKEFNKNEVLGKFIIRLRDNIVKNNPEKYDSDISKQVLMNELIPSALRMGQVKYRKVLNLNFENPQRTTARVGQPYVDNKFTKRVKQALSSQDAPIPLDMKSKSLLYDIEYVSPYITQVGGRRENLGKSENFKEVKETLWSGLYGDNLSSKDSRYNEYVNNRENADRQGIAVDITMRSDKDMIFVPKSKFNTLAQNYAEYLKSVGGLDVKTLLDAQGIKQNKKGEYEWTPADSEIATRQGTQILKDMVWGDIMGKNVWWYGENLRTDATINVLNQADRMKGYRNPSQIAMSPENISIVEAMIKASPDFKNKKKLLKDLNDFKNEEIYFVQDEIVGINGEKGDVAPGFGVNEKYIRQAKKRLKGVKEGSPEEIMINERINYYKQQPEISIIDGLGSIPQKYNDLIKLFSGEQNLRDTTMKPNITGRYSTGESFLVKTAANEHNLPKIVFAISANKAFGKKFPQELADKVIKVKKFEDLNDPSVYEGKGIKLFPREDSYSLNILQTKTVKEPTAPTNLMNYVGPKGEQAFLRDTILSAQNKEGTIRYARQQFNDFLNNGLFEQQILSISELAKNKRAEFQQSEFNSDNINGLIEALDMGAHPSLFGNQVRNLMYNGYLKDLAKPKIQDGFELVLKADTKYDNTLRPTIANKEYGVFDYGEAAVSHHYGRTVLTDRHWNKMSFFKKSDSKADQEIFWNDKARKKDPILKQLKREELTEFADVFNKLKELSPDMKYQISIGLFRNPITSRNSFIEVGIKEILGINDGNVMILNSHDVPYKISGDFDIDTSLSSAYLPKEVHQSLSRNNGSIDYAQSLESGTRPPNMSADGINNMDLISLENFRKFEQLGKEALGSAMMVNNHYKFFNTTKSEGMLLKDPATNQPLEGFYFQTKRKDGSDGNRIITQKTFKQLENFAEGVQNYNEALVDVSKNPFDVDRMISRKKVTEDLMFGNKDYDLEGQFRVLQVKKGEKETVLEEAPVDLTSTEKAFLSKIISMRSKMLSVVDKVYESNGYTRSSNGMDVKTAAMEYYKDLNNLKYFKIDGKKAEDLFNFHNFDKNANPFYISKGKMEIRPDYDKAYRSGNLTAQDIFLSETYIQLSRNFSRRNADLEALDPFMDTNLLIHRDRNINKALDHYKKEVIDLASKEDFINRKHTEIEQLTRAQKYYEKDSENYKYYENEIKKNKDFLTEARADWKETIGKGKQFQAIKKEFIENEISDLLSKNKDMTRKEAEPIAQQKFKKEGIKSIEPVNPEAFLQTYSMQEAFRHIAEKSYEDLGYTRHDYSKIDAEIAIWKKNYLKDLQKVRNDKHERFDDVFQLNESAVESFYQTVVEKYSMQGTNEAQVALARLMYEPVSKNKVVSFNKNLYPHIETKNSNSMKDFYLKFLETYSTNLESKIMKERFFAMYTKRYSELTGYENNFADGVLRELNAFEMAGQTFTNPLDYGGQYHKRQLLFEELGMKTSVDWSERLSQLDSYKRLHMLYGYGGVRDIINQTLTIDNQTLGIPKYAMSEMTKHGKGMSIDGIWGWQKLKQQDVLFYVNSNSSTNQLSHVIGSNKAGPVFMRRDKYTARERVDDIIENAFGPCLPKGVE